MAPTDNDRNHEPLLVGYLGYSMRVSLILEAIGCKILIPNYWLAYSKSRELQTEIY